jgi:hypothetical protein
MESQRMSSAHVAGWCATTHTYETERQQLVQQPGQLQEHHFPFTLSHWFLHSEAIVLAYFLAQLWHCSIHIVQRFALQTAIK